MKVVKTYRICVLFNLDMNHLMPHTIDQKFKVGNILKMFSKEVSYAHYTFSDPEFLISSVRSWHFG